MKIAAVILAAGSGTRFGGDKLAYKLRGVPIWKHSFLTYLNHPEVAEVIVVCSENNYPAIKAEVGESAEVILGGDTRTASTIAGLWKASKTNCDGILFHDAARPFVSADIIDRVIERVRAGEAVAAAIPSIDTMKRADDGAIVEHLQRKSLVAMQTPQGGPVQMFVKAFAAVQEPCTDDMEVLSKAGYNTGWVMGDAANFKITNPEDLLRARSLAGMETRTGLGYDIHRFSTDPARPCWLGGILFEGEIGLDGHSDADVVLHAVVDALLGAISAGDIGQLFPNTDAANKNRDSAEFLLEAKRLIDEGGWTVVNLDIAIQAEKPKIMPRALDIRTRIAGLLDINLDRVSIKATTQEGLGAIGRGEGIAAFATCNVSR
ncbi:MAG: 2-C-methyl-D-erythritol 2,4-cyclodiphosphate synthase [Armatimonadetes bacterium]|nr:2-C-methyl-D-erythritol 2,4-cyclodiphosphate synthase [Armatimonadota bacterium]